MMRRLGLAMVAVGLLLAASALAVSDRGGHLLATMSRLLTADAVRLVRIEGRGVSSIQVNDAASLTAALRDAQAGDVIALAPGTYSDFIVKGLKLNFDVPVMITSADPNNPANLTDFALTNVRGLTFRNLDFVAIAPDDAIASKNFSFKFNKAVDLVFDGVHVHGSLDNDPSNDSFGIQIRNSENVTVINSEFEQLGRGLAIGQTNNVEVVGNRTHDLRSDGFDFAEVNNVEVLNNLLTDFFPSQGDHPDAIQFWTSGTKTASHDILIAGNAILRGEGERVQGIFLRDQLGTLPFERVTIADNLVVGTGYNAIRVQGANDLTLTNNELVSFSGDYKTFLLIQGGDGVVARGNRAVSISFDNSVNVSESGNVVTGFVNDDGVAAIRSWLQMHPDKGMTLSGLLPINFTDDAPIGPPDLNPMVLNTAIFDIQSLYGGYVL